MKKKLEEYCYKEAGACDIIVSIIGGRYGSGSAKEDASISQVELKTALLLGKQVHIFVDRSVKSEHKFVQNNADIQNLKFSSVDNKKVFDYLNFVDSLPLNNATFSFEVANDIIEILREQWAGLFKLYLQDSSKKSEVQYINEIKETAHTLKQLVDYLYEDKNNANSAIESILSVNHPVFNRIVKLLGVEYRVFFSTRIEMTMWLNARNYTNVEEAYWDDEDIEEYVNNENDKLQRLLKIKSSIFDENGALRIITPQKWNDNFVSLEKKKLDVDELDDDLPF